MYHKKKASNQKKDNDTAVLQYSFSRVNNIDLKVTTIVGGWDYIQLSKHDKLIHVLKGSGTMKSPSEHLYLEKGVSFVALCDRETKISGQIQYLCATPKSDDELKMDKIHYKGTWQNLDTSKEAILYILDGLGFAEYDGNTVRLEEGSILELPQGADVKFNGNLEYLHITTK